MAWQKSYMCNFILGMVGLSFFHTRPMYYLFFVVILDFDMYTYVWIKNKNKINLGLFHATLFTDTEWTNQTSKNTL